MTPVLEDLPLEVAARLSRAGLGGYIKTPATPPPAWHRISSYHDLQGVHTPRCWMTTSLQPPPVERNDTWLCRPPAIPSNQWPKLRSLAALDATAVWIDSPFAPEHGYVLLIGGDHTRIAAAIPIIDAMAPAKGAWLHAGDLLAPLFFAAVAQEIGSSIAELVGIALNRTPLDWSIIPQSQYRMLRSLAKLANEYLALAGPTIMRPETSRPPELGIGPGIGLSPGFQLAHWLVAMASCIPEQPVVAE